MKKNFSILLVSLMILFSMTVKTLNAQPVSKEKKDTIIRLMQLTNSTKLANEVKQRVIVALKQSFPDAPPDYWRELNKRIDVQELLGSFIPIYARNLSLNDLKQLVTFYQTPAGQRYLAVREKMVAASVEKGKKWAMGWIVQVFKELKAKGYKPKGEKKPKKPGAKDKGAIDTSPNS